MIDSVIERHHRYEFNNTYREELEKNGLVFSGFSKDACIEMIEMLITLIHRLSISI